MAKQPKQPKHVFVKPAKDWYLVRKGLGQPYLKPEGESVPLTMYWIRRIRMGDVVEVSAMAVLGDDVAGQRAEKSKDKPKDSKGKDKS